MKNHPLYSVLVLVGAAALTGCVAHASATGSANAETEPPVVFTDTPTLIALDGGVWVVRDADRPTYYVEDTYWVVRDGVWYKSRSYDGGWVKAEASVVPSVIVNRTHTTYVHYKGEATAQTRPAPRAGESLTSANVAAPPGGPPGHDDIPGKGNQRKAEGEQPGQPTHTGIATAPEGPKHDPPGVGNQRKAEGTQPGQVGHGPAKPVAETKKDDDKKPAPKKNDKNDKKK